MDVYIHYLSICWGEGGRGMEKKENKTKQKQKQERASERTWLSPLLGGNTL